MKTQPTDNHPLTISYPSHKQSKINKKIPISAHKIHKITPKTPSSNIKIPNINSILKTFLIKKNYKKIKYLPYSKIKPKSNNKKHQLIKYNNKIKI